MQMRHMVEYSANPVTLEVAVCPEYVEAATDMNVRMREIGLKRLKLEGMSDAEIEVMQAMGSAAAMSQPGGGTADASAPTPSFPNGAVDPSRPSDGNGDAIAAMQLQALAQMQAMQGGAAAPSMPGAQTEPAQPDPMAMIQMAMAQMQGVPRATASGGGVDLTGGPDAAAIQQLQSMMMAMHQQQQ